MKSLESERLLLRAFEWSDFDAVHAWASDEIVTRYTPWGPNSEMETRDFLGRAIANAGSETTVECQFAVVGRELEVVMGSCSVIASRCEISEYEIGWTLDRTYWGQGFATEAARLVVDFAISSLGAARIFAPIDPENERSIALARRLGFREEGRTRDRDRDWAIYVRLAT